MLTREDLKGRKTTNAAHLYFGGGKGGWMFGVEGVPRLTGWSGMDGRRWHVDGKTVRDLDAALAVLNGTMTLEEAMPQPEPPKQPEPRPKFSIEQQIEEVERELGERAKVYPRLVRNGSMRQSIADFHVARMQAVKRTLEWVRDNRAELIAQTQKDPPPAEAEGGQA